MDFYLAELEQWTKDRRHRSRPGRKDVLAEFLSVRSDVVEAKAAGFPLKTIWEHLHETGRISFRYETFLRHVHRHLTNVAADKLYSAQQESTNTSQARNPTKNMSSADGFRFNATPSKEELF